ncbi:MAG: hypothetical protein ACYS8K_04835, partial [Planctomycetota bacterium]
TVRSRAAAALQHTRDAALLARVCRTHPDPMVRRRAFEALRANPGGSRRADLRRRDIAFTSRRTLGMELFGCFLDGLRDPDEGVRQQACDAVVEYAQSVRLVPVRATTRALEELADDESASQLVHEDAVRAIDEVQRPAAGELIVELVDQVLAWRGVLAREAHSMSCEEAGGAYVLDPAMAAEVVERWAKSYDLSPGQSAALQMAASGGPLDAATARCVQARLVDDLVVGLDCVAHAAAALRAIDSDALREAVEGWAEAVQAGPKLSWGADEGTEALQRRLSRWRRHAWIEACWAGQSLGGEPSPDALVDAAGDEDDWVRLLALRARAALDLDREAALEAMRDVARAHEGEAEFRLPIGLAAVAMAQAGKGGALELARFALGGPDLDLRMELTQKLTAVARPEPAATALVDYLIGQTLEDAAGLCMALALRAAGGSVEGLRVPADLAGGEWSEEPCARLALRAMDNEPEAAQRMKEVLREGEPEQRYCSGWYLSLSRVRSASLILSSVRDREGGPGELRALCAASLVRHGHPAALGGARKLLDAAHGRLKADLLTHLCRAVEDTVSRMLECGDVNLGRFV